MTQLNLHLLQQLNLPVSQMKVYTFTVFLASQCFILSCRLKMSFGTNCLPLSSAWTSVWILELPWTSRASDQSWTTRLNSSSSRRFEYYFFFGKKRSAWNQNVQRVSMFVTLIFLPFSCCALFNSMHDLITDSVVGVVHQLPSFQWQILPWYGWLILLRPCKLPAVTAIIDFYWNFSKVSISEQTKLTKCSSQAAFKSTKS